MSADKENEYFADGLAEEIINALSKIQALRVASRTSSFAFKGRKDVDAREIGEKLGVTTLLEGSVRRAGNNLRITAQLINAATDRHLWAHTYERVDRPRGEFSHTNWTGRGGHVAAGIYTV